MPTSNFDPASIPDLHGKTYLVTGGNTGIGKATVIGLAQHGATVYMGARSESKATSAILEMKNELPNADIRYLHMDLTNLSSVIAAAKELRRESQVLHGLINNAGIMAVEHSLTGDGLEIQLQTNYLSHWLLTHHLLPLLRATAQNLPAGSVRVASVSSDAHERFISKAGIEFENIELKNASAMGRYAQSKLAQILHIKTLESMYGPSSTSTSQKGEIWFASIHPGYIATNLLGQSTGMASAMVMKPVSKLMRCVGILEDQEKGAWNSLFATVSTNFKQENSGAYIVPYANIGTPSKHAIDAHMAKRLWEWTEQELGNRGMLELEV
jgi:NAD(P)-dependent dehydrogenase (short-subunit alcohol dehydrogenase family)